MKRTSSRDHRPIPPPPNLEKKGTRTRAINTADPRIEIQSVPEIDTTGPGVTKMTHDSLSIKERGTGRA